MAEPALAGAVIWAHAAWLATSSGASSTPVPRARIPDIFLDSIALTVRSDGAPVPGQRRVGARVQILQQVRQARNRMDGQTLLACEFLDGRIYRKASFVSAALHPVERDQHGDRLG